MYSLKRKFRGAAGGLGPHSGVGGRIWGTPPDKGKVLIKCERCARCSEFVAGIALASGHPCEKCQ